LYLPPVLVGLVTLTVAGPVANRIRWMPAVAAVFAAILLMGALTFGWDAVSYRLSHPGSVIGFAEDSAQTIGEALTIVAGLTATRRASERAGKCPRTVHRNA
jgi:hypothetical protein